MGEGVASIIAGVDVGVRLSGMVGISTGNRKIKNLKVKLRRMNF